MMVQNCKVTVGLFSRLFVLLMVWMQVRVSSTRTTKLTWQLLLEVSNTLGLAKTSVSGQQVEDGYLIQQFVVVVYILQVKSL